MALFDGGIFDSGIFDTAAVHPLGDVSLALTGRTTLAGDPRAEALFDLGDVTLLLAGTIGLEATVFPQYGEDEVGPGGPDDETIDPRARKWMRERYRKPEEPKQAVRGTAEVHALGPGGATPPPATNPEPLPSIDVQPLIEDAAQAARAALEHVAKERADRLREENKRRAVALLLAIDD